MMIEIEVLKAGLFSSIQDSGRSGLRSFGVPSSGAMDEWSAAIANALLGNDQNEPVIEMTLLGASFRFHADAEIALTGADMQPKLNDAPIEMHKSLEVKKGDVLDFGSARKGCRTYLGVLGRWKVPKIMGSASVYQVGGFGKALQKGDHISIENEERSGRAAKLTSAKGKIYLPSSLKLRFISGPEWNDLDAAQQADFQQWSYEVQSNSDRMGIRLRSDKALNIEREPMLSSPTATGCIQLTNSGHPVVLMRDGQTTGGYPRLGTVIRMDLNRLAQLKPGDRASFARISYEEAAVLLKAYRKNLNELFS